MRKLLLVGFLVFLCFRHEKCVPGPADNLPPLVTVSADTPAPAEKQSRWPRGVHQLEVSLSILHALEEGPVVCRVTLKNISNTEIDYATSMFSKGAYCSLESRGKLRAEPRMKGYLICGNTGPYLTTLRPGETASELFFLHPSFMSIPSGKATIRFGWNVDRIVKNHEDSSLSRGSLETLFELKGSQVIDILPATPKNLAPLLSKLEAEFGRVMKRLEGSSDYLWQSHDPAAEFVSTISRCRHKEFIPLLQRGIDRIPAADFRRQFVANVYECCATPEEAFAILADYLASSIPSATNEIFDYWADQEREHEKSKERQAKLKQPLSTKADTDQAKSDEFQRELRQSEEEAWKTASRHLDSRLTNAQLLKLQAHRDVWVRTLLYSHFPTRCSPEWIDSLHADLRKVGKRPEGFAELLAQLDDDRFTVREQATAQLIDRGPNFASQLWAMPLEKVSAEVAQRLRVVRERVKKPELNALCRRTLRQLAIGSKSHNQTLLNILRQGDCPNLISQAAEEAWVEFKSSR